MIKDKQLSLALEIDGFEYYVFHPTFGRWLYKNYESFRLQRWVRFLFEYLADGKYVVYYIAKSDVILGYCFVAPGGRRLKCSTPADIVLGPYYIIPEFRGSGYSKAMISTVLEKLQTSYEYAYDYIAKTNIPSIRVTEACGFKKYKELNISPINRRLLIADNGEYYVYRKARKKEAISSNIPLFG